MTSNVRGLTRVALLALAACFLSAACEDDTPAPAPAPAPAPPPAPEPEPEPEPMVEDSAMAMRWWNTLDGPQMVAALHGDEATEEQSAAAMMMYADLDADTKTRVNDTAAELYGEGGHMSVGAWWETLDCRLMRVAAGDGNMADPMSTYCAHYPGSGAEKILSDEAKAWVDMVGMALLGLDEPGMYPPASEMAMRWWNSLDGPQMTAALYGEDADEMQRGLAMRPYMNLEPETRRVVNEAADELYGEGGHMSVGAWWETLDCRLMRVAVGDGNVADPSSDFCAHYPGSGAARLLGSLPLVRVNHVGRALLGRDDIGTYPADSGMAMRWWNTLNGEQMIRALYGRMATPEQKDMAKRPYDMLEGETKRIVNETADELYGDGGHMSVGAWWETLDCRLMRVAVGDGNNAYAGSPFCAHYPGSGAAKILDDMSKAFVDKVGIALLGLDEPGLYPYSEMAMRWWNTLNGEQMVAALHGEMATAIQEHRAMMPYMDLDPGTRYLVHQATYEIYGDGGHPSVGAWWETLDCRLMRIAAGDGNTADPMSPFCAHYPGSGAARILDDESKMWVDTVGMALLGREDPGMYP